MIASLDTGLTESGNLVKGKMMRSEGIKAEVSVCWTIALVHWPCFIFDFNDTLSASLDQSTYSPSGRDEVNSRSRLLLHSST